MKVVIELFGNESKCDLLATSNYLRELAGEAVPEVTERKTDLDKLADAVVEATQVREEAPKTVAEIVESERAKTRAKRSAKVEPVVEPEEDKVRPEDKDRSEEEEAAEAKAAAKAAAEETTYTIEDCKAWAMKALNAKKRPIVQEAFEHVGASSFPTLKPEMFNDFVDYISSRL